LPRKRILMPLNPTSRKLKNWWHRSRCDRGRFAARTALPNLGSWSQSVIERSSKLSMNLRVGRGILTEPMGPSINAHRLRGTRRPTKPGGSWSQCATIFWDWGLSMNLKMLSLISKDLRISGSRSQCMRKIERGLSMNRRSQKSARFWTAPVLWRFGSTVSPGGEGRHRLGGCASGGKAAEDCRSPRRSRAGVRRAGVHGPNALANFGIGGFP